MQFVPVAKYFGIIFHIAKRCLQFIYYICLHNRNRPWIFWRDDGPSFGIGAEKLTIYSFSLIINYFFRFFMVRLVRVVMWSPDADRGHWYWALLCNSQHLILNWTNQINQNYCHPTIGQLNKNYLVQGLKAISHKRNRLNAFYVQMVNICNEKLITVFMKCNFELPCFLLSLNWDQAEPQHHSYGHGSCVIILWSSVLSAQVDKVSLNTTLLLLSLSLFFVIHTFYSIEWRTSKVYWHHTLRLRSFRCWLLQRNQVKVQKSVCKWKEVW